MLVQRAPGPTHEFDAHDASQRALELRRRHEHRAQATQSVHAAVQNAMQQLQHEERQTSALGGCGAWITRLLRRRRAPDSAIDLNVHDLKSFLSATRDATESAAPLTTSTAASSSSCATSHGLSTRLFGVRRHAAQGTSSPSAKLSQATAAIEARIAELKQRAATARAQALAAHKSGDKMTAMRMMHRAKACDKQIEAMWNASSALERQSEMLEEASLQKQVTDALSVSVKKMKGSQRLLEGVDKLSDEAAEMRDISDDIKTALESMSQSTLDPSLDDDDLLAELQAMQEEEAEVVKEAPVSAEQDASAQTPVAITMPTFPSAPSTLSTLPTSSTQRLAYPQTPSVASAFTGLG